MYFYFILIYVFLSYFFAFLYGFLVQEFNFSIIAVLFWPVIILLYPIGGTIFFVFNCGRGCMERLKRREEEEKEEKIPEEEKIYEDVEVIIDDFGPLQFYLLRREVI
jgi:predicted membrane protein